MLKDIYAKYVGMIKSNLKIVAIVVGVVVLIAVAGLYYMFGANLMTAEAAAQKAVNYINVNLLKVDAAEGVSLKSASRDGAIYKATITYKGQDSEIFITKDGKYLFPVMQGVPILLDDTSSSPTADDTTTVTTCEAMPKADSPVLTAFVMSNCPFGLQMQRVFAKAISEGIPKSNLVVRYIGAISNNKITSMHGDEEAQENLRQICIREEQPTKFWNYLSCYIKAGATDSCLTSTGVDKTSLNTCMTDSNKGFKYAQADFDLSNQYGASGSPTLILGDSKIDEFSFGGRTADAIKSIVCCASNNQSAYCSTTMSKDSAASSFSATYTAAAGAAQDASCGQ